MNKNLMPFAVMLSLSAAFVMFDKANKLVSKADMNEDINTVKSFNETTTVSSLFDETEETSVETSVSTALTSASESETSESSATETSAVSYYKSEKEIGSYSEDFTALTADELALLYKEGIVISGDSIASGYKVYNRLPERQCMATGSLGARNIHEFTVPISGTEYSMKSAMQILKPKYICMSMGMNDLNIGSKEDFISNYNANIDELHSASPDSVFVIMAITPISAQSTHSTNAKIDEYNAALKEMVQQRNDIPIYYVNAAQTLKNQWNSLSMEYSGGDGIHLMPVAYDVMLTYLLGALSEIDNSYTNKLPVVSEVTTAPVWTQEYDSPAITIQSSAEEYSYQQ